MLSFPTLCILSCWISFLKTCLKSNTMSNSTARPTNSTKHPWPSFFNPNLTFESCSQMQLISFTNRCLPQSCRSPRISMECSLQIAAKDPHEFTVKVSKKILKISMVVTKLSGLPVLNWPDSSRTNGLFSIGSQGMCSWELVPLKESTGELQGSWLPWPTIDSNSK